MPYEFFVLSALLSDSILLMRTFRVSPFFSVYWGTVDLQGCVLGMQQSDPATHTHISTLVATTPGVSNPSFLTPSVESASASRSEFWGAPSPGSVWECACRTLTPSPRAALAQAPLRASAFEGRATVPGASLRAPSHPAWAALLHLLFLLERFTRAQASWSSLPEHLCLTEPSHRPPEASGTSGGRCGPTEAQESRVIP